MPCAIGDMEIVDPVNLWNPRNLVPLTNPQNAGWFVLEEVSNISTADVGWHLAAGWIITASEDDSNNPPHKKYSMKRNVMQSADVLNDVIDQYVKSYNEGRELNDTRYDDIVAMYNDTLLKTQSHLDRAADCNDTYDTLFLTSLNTIVDQIDVLLNSTKVGAALSFDAATDSLNLFAAKLAQLEPGNSTFVTAIETILTNQQADLATFEGRTGALLTQLSADYTATVASINSLQGTEDSEAASHIAIYDAKLAELETTIDTVETDLLALVDDAEAAWLEYETEAKGIITTIGGDLTSLESTINTAMDAIDTAVGGHKVTHASLVALFLSDFTTHAATARAFLVDLGTTELSRISETWDNDLTKKNQQLIGRGLYSSSLITQVTTRNTREKNEQITELNDRLAREKLVDEHVLYGQQMTVRQQQVAGEEYQFRMTQVAIDYRAGWAERLYGHALETQKVFLGIRDSLRVAENQFITQEMGVKERIASWRLETKKAVADGKDRVYQIRSGINRWKTDNTFKLDSLLRLVRGLNLDIYVKDLTSQLDVEKFAARSREAIVSKLNQYVNDFIAGQTKYSGLTIQNGQFLAAVRDRATADAIQTRFQYTAGLTTSNRAEQQLYKFQIDARNNLAVGMFKFMERRTDSYPDVGRIGEIAVGLGDAGASTWVNAQGG